MPFPRPVPRWAWPLVIGGWLLLSGAAAAMLWLSDRYGIAALAGLGCVGVGCYLLSGRAAALTVAGTMIGGILLFTGLAIGSDALAENLWGETARCQVTRVEKSTYTTKRKTRTRYIHDLECPAGAYSLGASRPFPVGERVEVIFDPHRHLPEFTFGRRHQDLTVSVVLLAVGGPAIVLLPFGARLVGRRRAERGAFSPPPPPPPPATGNQPYETWPSAAGKASRYGL